MRCNNKEESCSKLKLQIKTLKGVGKTSAWIREFYSCQGKRLITRLLKQISQEEESSEKK